MREHTVVIAGGGPTGLMLAGELALANVDVAVVERRVSQDLDGLRAGGLHIRTIEVLDQRGIAGRFISQGRTVRSAPFAGKAFDIGDLPTRHSYFLVLWQVHIERILSEWIRELGVSIYGGSEVTSFKQDDAGVEIQRSEGGALRAKYLVGCDGGRSLIRKKAGIEFPGWEPSTSYLIAEVEMAEEPEWGIRRSEKGINAIAKLEGGRARVVLNEGQVVRGSEPVLEDLRQALIGLYGTDYGLRSATNVSRFTDMARQAARYRDRRVLLAGDAAHVHSPVGGQGLNIGVQDAVNLGWKLAQVVRGISPESLLDTYQAERHPVGARLLRNTMALTAIERSDDRISALREMILELMGNAEVRKRYFAMISGLDVHYDLGEGHPLLGRRMPDLDVTTACGSLRVFTLLHDGKPVLLNFGDGDSLDIDGWGDRVRWIEAKYEGVWELPAMGPIPGPAAVLVRPDGYVAWVADEHGRAGLAESLRKWFGRPVAA